jgi:hypothetical protein
VLLALAALGEAGCASVSYIDAGGGRHILGLVNLTLAPTPSGAAQLTGVTTIGVAVRRGGPSGAVLALGYSRDVVVSVPSDACIDLARPGPCAERRIAAASSQLQETRP